MNISLIRERLSLALIAGLPFHAFAVTVLTKLLFGEGNAPWSALIIWKEVLLAVILGLSIVEIYQQLKRKKKIALLELIDITDVLIISLMIIAVAVSSMTHGNIKLFIYGWKYDFLPLVLFMILKRVQWSDTFVHYLQRVFIIVSSIIVVFGISSVFIPQQFFLSLGYSDLHSIYVAGKPLAAFQYISETGMRRIQSVMSGPNQLGIWLLIPLSFAIMSTLYSKFPKDKSFERLLGWFYADRKSRKWFRRIYIASLVIALFLSFSRSAWLAAMLMVLVAFLRHFGRQRFWRWTVRFGAACVFFLFMVTMLAPDAILRISSSRGHLVRPIQAFYKMVDSPLGGGLGSAGPASHKVTDTCVHLRPQDDPSWAADRPDLCVFLGDKQVQPANKDCQCPQLPENWYLQIGLELGIVGFLMYISLLGFIFKKLWQWKNIFDADAVLLTFIGIGMSGMTLHAWEDAATAYTGWLLVAMIFSRHASHSHFFRSKNKLGLTT